ncbi:MAG: DUF4851 domain-containing protein [Desulfovibrio sp.]|jgi:hypothetical protein|nr:DUF4851 domain-containing protein [Desulfovibrio sp.]
MLKNVLSIRELGVKVCPLLAKQAVGVRDAGKYAQFMKLSAACCAIALMMCLLACPAARQRGMNGAAYVSTAKPAISLRAATLPLLAGGEGQASLLAGSMPIGAPVRVWLAAYGEASPQGPLAIVAHAEVQRGWYWDGAMRRPFSVNEGVEVLGGLEFQACTYLVDGERDPFTALVGAEGLPIRWIARGFAARTNFYEDKIILEYRERLPENVTSLTALPLGHGDFVREFEQRARGSFVIAPPPAEMASLEKKYAKAVRWRYMTEKFLGSASKYDVFNRP